MPGRKAEPFQPPEPRPDIDSRIEEGKRLIRLPDAQAQPLTARIADHIVRLSWRTPLHRLALRGRYPLKLLAVPEDRVIGDADAGQAIRAGYLLFRGARTDLRTLDFGTLDGNADPDFAVHVHSFAWLRDLATVASRAQAAPIAEHLLRRWIAAHDERVEEPAWRADIAGRRILFWTAYAPLLMSHGDIVLRSKVLNGIARTARHLDRSAARAAAGLPQIAAWSGLLTASLLIPGGQARRLVAEAGLKKTLAAAVTDDGGIVSRAPLEQADAVMLLGMVRGAYEAVREPLPPFLPNVLQRMVPALLGASHGDSGLASFQGTGAGTGQWVANVAAASGVRARALKQARDWGYQRLACGRTVVIVDAAPPPLAKTNAGGCASTLAIEMSVGGQRLFTSCGGAALSPGDRRLARSLRTTAAHSTLVLDDSNSTAILPGGPLGRGVVEIELDRRESEQGSRLELCHDGYIRRYGFSHRRLLILATDGRELRGEDMLIPAGRGRAKKHVPFAIRFHLGEGVEATAIAEPQGALLRLPGGATWQFRCSGGTLTLEDSIWADAAGALHPGQQLVISGETDPGGCSVGWLVKQRG